MLKNDMSGPAFPQTNLECPPGAWGLTKREYFAAMAMQGHLSHPDIGHEDSVRIANLSVEQADALLKALGENNG